MRAQTQEKHARPRTHPHEHSAPLLAIMVDSIKAEGTKVRTFKAHYAFLVYLQETDQTSDEAQIIQIRQRDIRAERSWKIHEQFIEIGLPTPRSLFFKYTRVIPRFAVVRQ